MKISPNLYEELMALTESAAFYFSDQILDGRTYRIFNYRLASYSDFLMPSALNCRGTMFDVTEEPRLVCLPMHKFFNLNENPFTQNVDLDKVDRIAVKSDGSLISSFLHNGELRLKSKGSLTSPQVAAASEWLEQRKHLKATIQALTSVGWTVNMEWVAPDNRVVLNYENPRLIVLNVRGTDTGKYLDEEGTRVSFGEHMAEPVTPENAAEFVRSIPAMTEDIEGFVCQAGDLWFKVKTDKYCALHHCKDSVNEPRRLFEVILSEGVDDVRAMFFDDSATIARIDAMEKKVDNLYNGMVAEVEAFYAANKELDRKSYAIKGQAEVTPMYFPLVMAKYSGKPDDYKGFLLGRWKDLAASLA